MGCNNISKKEGTVIAKYKDNKLYLEEVNTQVNVLGSEEDSIARINALVNSWLSQQVLLDNAKRELGDSAKAFNDLIESYKNSLYIYHYQDKLGKSIVDSTLADSTLVNYYNANKRNFELKRNIVKIWYAKFLKETEITEDFKNNFKQPQEGSMEFVKEYCERFAENHYLSKDEWLYFDEIRKEIPLDPSYDPALFIRNNKIRQFEDAKYVYWLSIIDYKVKNNITPFDLVEDEIKQMILNQRRVKALNNKHKELIKQAIENGNAKIY